MKLGFSNGVLYKLEVNRWEQEHFQRFLKLGANAIELNIIDHKHIDELQKLPAVFIEGFDFISIHGPSLIYYEDNSETKVVLKKIEEITKKFSISAVVLHPDRIHNWEVFKDFDIPFAIENMDNRKEAGQTVQDLQEYFKLVNYGFVLDINHVLTVDPSLKLAYELIDSFGERLVEVHLSGYGPGSHVPLFKTKQDKLIDFVKDLEKPVIIESVFKSVDELEIEWDYIQARIS